MQEKHPEEIIAELDSRICADSTDDNLFYERGNAYWKLQDWKHCLDDYTEAIRLNPQSPAAEMKRMVLGILDFYNKEMFNP